MPLYGADSVAWPTFEGGLVLDQDATTLDDDQCSDCQNVEFRDSGLSVRRGYATAATIATAAKVNGLHRYYKTDNTVKFLAQGSTHIYEDNGSGALASAVSGLTGGVPFDFVGWKDLVFAGSSVDALRKRTAAGSWSTVAPLTAPSTPTVAPYRPVLHNFDSSTEHASDYASGWVWTDTGNTAIADVTDDHLEGTQALSFTFSSGSKGDSATRQFSLGATVDLSTAQALIVWHQANKAKATFQVGIVPNNPATLLNGDITSGATTLTATSATGYAAGDYIRIESEVLKITGISGTTFTVVRGQHGTSAAAHDGVGAGQTTIHQAVNWDLWDTFTTAAANTWVPIRIPLDGLPPARRTAACAVGIRLLSPGADFSPAPVLTFDHLLAEGPLELDSYTYSTTYAATTRINNVDVVTQESNPASATVFQLEELPPSWGVRITPSGTPDSGVTIFRIYRYRNTGPFRRGRLIGTAPTAATAINDATDISATDLEIVVDSVVGYSVGCVATIDSEEVLVRAVNGTTSTLTVSRGFNGTTAAAHLDNAAVTFSYFVDTRPDGELALENAEELEEGKIAPPLAATYALCNSRLFAANCTVGGTNYPWRIYVSRAFFPEEFRQEQEPDGNPASAGWFDLPSKDYIRRLVEFDGSLLIFTDRSIWTLDGTGWNDFAVFPRARVGLDAREAVAVTDRLIYFLSADGVRVLAPNQTSDNLFPTWVISEPVDSRLRAIPYAYRSLAAMGVDERGRLHLSLTRAGQTVNDATLLFDPYAGGLGEQGYAPKRRGWTYFTSFGWSAYLTLKRGGGDAGQLVAGNASAAGNVTLSYLQRSSADADLTTDAGSSIAFDWTSKALDTGLQTLGELAFVALEADANAGASTTINDTGSVTTDTTATSIVVTSAASFLTNDYVQIDSEVLLITNIVSNTLTVTRAQAGTTAAVHANGSTVTLVRVVTLTPVLDGAASSSTYPVACGTAASGFVAKDRRVAASQRARYVGLKLSGTARAAVRIRSARLGLYRRG